MHEKKEMDEDKANELEKSMMSGEKKEMTEEETDKLIESMFLEQRPKILEFFNGLYFEALEKIDKESIDGLSKTMGKIVGPYQILIIDMFLKTSTMGFAANLGGPPENNTQALKFSKVAHNHVLAILDTTIQMQDPKNFTVGDGTGLTMTYTEESEMKEIEAWKNVPEL